jgi:hypothetical protein
MLYFLTGSTPPHHIQNSIGAIVVTQAILKKEGILIDSKGSD